MQAIPHRQSLLECFNNYCIRTQSQHGGLHSTFSPIRNSRHSIQQRLKSKPSVNGPPMSKSPTHLRQRRLLQEGRQRRSDNCQLLNITPVVVHTSVQSYKQTIRTSSSITIHRKLLRAKTEGEQTNRSSSPFFTQQKEKHGCETPFLTSSSGEINNKNRPFTAFPSYQHSVNRLRTIQIELPTRHKLERAMSFFDQGVTAWETRQQ